PLPACRRGAYRDRPSALGTAHHDGRAGALALRQIACRQEAHLDRLPLAADDRAVGIGLVEGAQQAAPAGAPAAAGLTKFARLARRRKRACRAERLALDDGGAVLDERIERAAVSRPVDAGLGGAARRHADGADTATTGALGEAGHGTHQRLADG